MKNVLLFLCLILFACNENTTNNSHSYFNKIAQNDIKLKPPKEGDWLYHHHEKGQSFYDYVAINPTKLNDSQNIIYLQGMGTFKAIDLQTIELAQQFLSIFFQTETKLLPTINDDIIPKNKRRMNDGNEQIMSTYLLDPFLIQKKPKDAIAYMLFTEKDLYPSDDWNFVFGQASYPDRVGATSIFRLNPQNDNNLFLERVLKIASHEIGHMFTIAHCTNAHCLMNGANSMEETDISPLRLCSECQHKLSWNIQYDNNKRIKELLKFYVENNLKNAYQLCKKDYDCLAK